MLDLCQPLKLVARNREELDGTLTEKQKETLEKFEDCWGEYASYAEKAIFEYAFRLGARMAMEIQKDTDT